MWLYVLQNYAVIVFVSLIAVSLMLWLRRKIGVHRLRLNHEVAGVIYAVVGTIFAVTVALVVDTVHDEYLIAEKNTAREAFQIANIYLLADWFPAGDGSELKLSLTQYVKTVVETEWPRSTSMLNKSSPEADQAFLQITRQIRELKPVSFHQQSAYAEMLQRLSSMTEARYLRIFEQHPGIPAAMWMIVITGAIITICFTMFFAMESTHAQILIVFAVTALICSNFMLLFTVQYPFNGLSITPPYPFLELLKRF